MTTAKTSKFASKFFEYVAAAFSGIWVESVEHEEACREIREVCTQHGWGFGMWDPEDGFVGNYEKPNVAGPVATPEDSPLWPLRAIRRAQADNPDDPVILVVRNLHGYLLSAEGRPLNPKAIQATQTAIEYGARNSRFLVFLGYPGMQLPADLNKHVITLSHDLPGHDELWDLANSIDEEVAESLPPRESDEATMILNAASGLTRMEALGAYSLSVARHHTIKPDTLWELKAQALKQASGLELLKTDITLDDVVGLDPLKQYLTKTFASKRRHEPDLRPRGAFLFGLPGSGKSMLCKALGHALNLPTVRLDIGSLMGGLVGQTEQNTRMALQRLDSMAPCITFMD